MVCLLNTGLHYCHYGSYICVFIHCLVSCVSMKHYHIPISCMMNRDYVRQEVRPAILVRESGMQLIRYSLDTCIRYSTYLLIFKSQKDSIGALNFLITTP